MEHSRDQHDLFNDASLISYTYYIYFRFGSILLSKVAFSVRLATSLTLFGFLLDDADIEDLNSFPFPGRNSPIFVGFSSVMERRRLERGIHSEANP